MRNLQRNRTNALAGQGTFPALAQAESQIDAHALPLLPFDGPIEDDNLSVLPVHVQTTYSPDGDFITWPQGNTAEIRASGFGLEVPNLMSRHSTWTIAPLCARPGLREMLSYARSKDLGFKLVVPTARYADDPQLAELHFAMLLYDLIDATYGELPENFRLCLGCDYADQMEFSGRPQAYGRVVNAMLNVARTIEKSELASIRISVQMGCDESEHAEIRKQISPQNLKTYFSLNGCSNPPH